MKNLNNKNELEQSGEKGLNGEEDLAVAFSVNLINALEEKSEHHNKENSNSKATLQQLKRVYIHGANNFISSTNPEGSLNLWGLARVDMFLSYKAGNKISIESKEPSPSKMKELAFEIQSRNTSINHFLDVTTEWTPSRENFEKAKEDIKKYNLNYSFSSLEDIYLEYKQIELQWE
tara:strand:+ start:60 stop:587 length:528 start_codon:yes stop_codon:yes gene_type:complete